MKESKKNRIKHQAGKGVGRRQSDREIKGKEGRGVRDELAEIEGKGM